MIRPLRRRHRAVVCALGILLPGALAIGVASRQAARVAPIRSWGGEKAEQQLWTKGDLWPDKAITTSLHRTGDGAIAVQCSVTKLAKPDVLMYWIPNTQAIGEALPESARLLGAFASGSLLPVPGDIAGQSGQFLLYSLADQEIVALSKLLSLPSN